MALGRSGFRVVWFYGTRVSVLSGFRESLCYWCRALGYFWALGSGDFRVF